MTIYIPVPTQALSAIPFKAGTRDVFSPANIKPEDFVYVGAVYLGTSEEVHAVYASCPESKAAMEVLHMCAATTKWKIAKCDHCGAKYAYGCVYMHKPTATAICVGHVCAKETLSYPTRAALDFVRLKKQVATTKEELKIKAKVDAFLATRPELAAAFNECTHHIVQDIKGKLWRWGSISDAQADVCVKINNDSKARTIAEAKRLETAVPVVDGVAVVTGEVLSIKEVEGEFGTQLKMLILTPTGSKLYGTVPASIVHEVKRGCTVNFKATVNGSKNDKFFGFFSRPRNASIVSFPEPKNESVHAEAA
jgi:hypothetical protein